MLFPVISYSDVTVDIMRLLTGKSFQGNAKKL